MKKNTVRGRKTRLSLAIFAIVSATAGFTSNAIAQEEGAVEQISVTGSRIRNVDGMTTATPVTAVTIQDLQNFNPGGTMAEQLDALPQFFATATAQRGGGTFSTGSGSYLNLRGMGQQRTLVLLDGSRVVPADSQGSVNIDNFPSALLKRVDVVTGGASAAYGADAVSGVVNFILDREFEGVKATVSAGVSERRDGENWNFSIAGGKEILPGLNVVGSMQARTIDQIEPDHTRLDNWDEWGYVNNPAWSSSDPAGTNPRRIVTKNVFNNNTSATGLITNGGSLTGMTFTDDGQDVRPYLYGDLQSGSLQSGGLEYSRYQDSRSRGPDGNAVEQKSFFGAIKYDVTDKLTVTAQAILGRTESNFDGARSDPIFGGSNYSYTLFSGNPYLPQSVQDVMTNEGLDSITFAKRGQVRAPGIVNLYGNRKDRNKSELDSFTVGFDYNINDNWSVTGHFQRGESTVTTGIVNIPRTDRLFMAMDAVAGPGGEPICNITAVNPTPAQLAAEVAGVYVPSAFSLDGVLVDSPIGPMDPSECIPINVLGLGVNSQEAIDWIEGDPKFNHRTLDQDFFELIVSGQIHEGWGAGGISLAAGYTNRDEEFTQQSTPVYGERGLLNAPTLGIRGIARGFVGKGNRSIHPFSAIGSAGGGYDVSEVFAELDVPIFENSNGQAVKSNFAFRRSDYSTSGEVDSWKVGVEFQVIDDLRLRMTRSHDVREPNFSEQYVAGTGGGFVIDPLDGSSNRTLTVASGPNPDLNIEEADTTVVGFVYQPTFADWIEGFQISMDWYEIDLGSAVGRYGAQRLADDCFNTGNAYICSLVQRENDIPTAPIQRIINEYVNVGGALTEGVDMEIQYSTDLNFFDDLDENFSLRFLGGYLKENSTTSAAGTTDDIVGQVTRPEFSANITADYTVGPYGIRVQQRFYDSTFLDEDWVEGVDIDDNTVASNSLTNLVLSYTKETSRGGEWTTSFNITNLFDREPPVYIARGTQSISNSFDQFGRRYQLSLNVSF